MSGRRPHDARGLRLDAMIQAGQDEGVDRKALAATLRDACRPPEGYDFDAALRDGGPLAYPAEGGGWELYGHDAVVVPAALLRLVADVLDGKAPMKVGRQSDPDLWLKKRQAWAAVRAAREAGRQAKVVVPDVAERFGITVAMLYRWLEEVDD
ncbi:MAG: hypothetical protein ACK4QW_09940 [Alphaproteobacteria bacterium]